ncbi:hypothetical protein GCM10011321_05870 [Youhaiella tibetensis]|uniref:GyrI-like domain-containing protein n=1 Tax=Paradevosia tibetensis TaxID=1447062 RepID=A0A5B9DPS4_9HYPH|nr:GyrI-like domain-containing protein [Youhaiella tibetensis]AKR56174.1 hypothetical protein XM25_10265 [Devosia sp. H5989]QEE21227.1 GyrI-like domain-containing protein [Youhaiella tibetensis]GGF16840.1 hypothetical protein GCM10011321_05870 [Youhaiella tibetensis]
MIPLLDIGIIEVAPLLLAAVRDRVALSALSDAISNSPVWERVRERGLQHSGRNVVIYWGGEEEVTVDIGVEVTEPFCGDDDLQCVAVPTGRAVTATHTGPDHLLPHVHERIRSWSAEGERKLAGVHWEVSQGEPDDPAQRQTQVFYLIREPTARATPRKKWPRFNERSRPA